MLKKICLCAIAIFLPLMFYLSAFNHTEPTELGVAWNVATGEMWAQKGGGWHVTPPWVLVSTIDLRQMRVTITTAGRGFGAKLIQFNPDEWQIFVKTEGFRYWWWANRISFNLGYNEEYRGVRDILRGYAFGIKSYPFIKVLQEVDQ